MLIPRAALVPAKSSQSGPGFSDLRAEERGDDMLLSFRLQQGASVSVSQNFNRLDIAFNTNEQTDRTPPAKAAKEIPMKFSSPD